MTAQESRPWWRDRADEIERQVACGQMSAMQCFTKMQELLNAKPVARTPLSDERLKAMWAMYASYPGGVIDFARAAIAASCGITQEKQA